MVCSPAAEDISLGDDLSGANYLVIGVLSPPFEEELVVLSLSVAAAFSYSAFVDIISNFFLRRRRGSR